MPRHGENIRKRKDGRWEGRYYIESQSGRKIARSVYAGTYAQVKEKLLAEKLSKESFPKEEKGRKIAFSEAASEWMQFIEKNRKYATYIKYQTIYHKYIEKKLSECTFSELNNTELSELFQTYESEVQSESMKRSIACVLNQILAYAELHYHTPHFQFSHQKQRCISRPITVLNQTEQTRLLQYLYRDMDIYKFGILLCISTGLRLGEICSLKWEDIDLSGKILHVNTTVQRIAVDGQKSRTILLEGDPKSVFSKREIPLSEDIIKLMDTYYDTAAKYVLNTDKPMEPRTYQNKFQSYLKMAGIEKKNFHALRHTFATNCIDSGADVKSLSEILGHSDVKITLNRYVHPTLETKRQHMNSLSFIYGQILGQK